MKVAIKYENSERREMSIKDITTLQCERERVLSSTTFRI